MSTIFSIFVIIGIVTASYLMIRLLFTDTSGGDDPINDWFFKKKDH